MQAIPLFHPYRSAASDAAALEVLHSGQIASGPKVAAFEAALGARLGQAHLIGTNDMSAAMRLALCVLDVGPGDEVLSPAYTCLSSAAPIANLGARPRWVDVEADTGLLEPAALRDALATSPLPKACVVYHAAGYPARTAEVAALCRAAGVPLIEDCNSALGAVQQGRPVGQIGDAAVFSFYPNRQVNAADGGALAVRDADRAARARRLRRFGIALAGFRDAHGEIEPASDVQEIGCSAALSQLHAAIGLSHLDDLDLRLAATRANAAALGARLEGLPGLRVVHPTPDSQPQPWGLLVLIDSRDAALAALKAAGVQCSKLHHRLDRYTGFHASAAQLPGTASFLARVLALPCGDWLTDADLDHIASTLRRVL